MLDRNRKSLPTESQSDSRRLKRFSELPLKAIAPERLVRLILKILEMRKPKPRYAVIASALTSFLQFKRPLMLPSRTADKLYGMMLHLDRTQN